MTADELDAIREIRDLVHRYALCADRRDGAGFADLFSADGEMIGIQHGESGPFFGATGRDELLDVIHGNDGFPRTFHFVGTHHCEVKGSRATGVTYCVAHHLRAEGPAAETISWLIRYNDEFERGPQGWRFRRRVLELMWVQYHDSDTSAFPFRNGWVDA